MKHNIHLPSSSNFAFVCVVVALFVHPSEDAPFSVFVTYGGIMVVALLIAIILKIREQK